jgi:hypothetical protein
MKTQKEIENDIVAYFKKNVESAIKINNEDYYHDLIKIPFTYIDFSSTMSFAPDPIDFAIYSKKENKVIAIEYPWRQKNGELTYNKINL